MSWRYLQNRWFSSNWYGKFANLLESWHPNKNEEQTHALPSHLFTPSILTPRLPMGRDAGAVRQVFQQHDTTWPQNRCCSDQWTSAKQTQIQRGSLQPAFLRLHVSLICDDPSWVNCMESSLRGQWILPWPPPFAGLLRSWSAPPRW